MFSNCKAIITGGAGFIGSHLTEELLSKACKVTVIDDFSSGSLENVRHLIDDPSLTLIERDLKKPSGLAEIISGNDLVFHLAANPEVRVGQTAPRVHFEENVLATFNLLEAIRRAGKGMKLVFTSTSTVYGEASQIPTREDYAPLIPISTYGASKLASEALICSYSQTFGHRALILRLANVIGPRSNHGVIVDFMKKILANPRELEILGDGKQEKSYMYVTDLVDAIIHLTRIFIESTGKTEIYNVGSSDRINVKEIAEAVAEEMSRPEVRFKYTGGVDGGRGWKGDVKLMQLSIQKLLSTGWKPKYSSKEAITLAISELKKTLRTKM